jgi:hypothetical protein
VTSEDSRRLPSGAAPVTPETIISVPVHTLVRPATIATGAGGRTRHWPVAGLESDPAIDPDPTRIAVVATTRTRTRRGERFAVLPSLNMVPPFEGV